MIEVDPPRDWFFTLPEGWDPVTNPDDPLIWIDRDSGRMAALVAPHDSCILDGTESMRCVRPPISKTGYSYAHVGYTRLQGGDGIKTANIGGRVNHAGQQASTSMAQDHYANTATRWARVRYMEDDAKNIWAAGALSPGLDPHDLVEIEGSALSGDWRWVEQLTGHEMAGSQLVNVPGFRPAHAHQFVITAGMLPGQYVGAWRAAAGSQGVVLVALPMGDPFPDAHVTIAYVGSLDQMGEIDPKPLLQVTATAAIRCNPFMAQVAGVGSLGDSDRVALLESPELQWLRDSLGVFDEGRFPSFIPHMSLPGAASVPANYYIFDRLALWAGDQRWEFPLVGDQIIEAAAAAVEPPNIDDDEVDSDWLKVFAKARAMKEYPGTWEEAIGAIDIGPPGLDPKDFIDVDSLDAA